MAQLFTSKRQLFDSVLVKTKIGGARNSLSLSLPIVSGILASLSPDNRPEI
jgi:hypothetical protein